MSDYSNQRIAWIDTLRGFGILLVILSHCSVPSLLHAAMYTFYMPLFFLICGFLWKDDTLAKYSFKS